MDDHSPFPATLRSSGDLAADRRYAWAMAALKDGAAAEAIDLFEQAAEIVPGWAPIWLGLGDAREASGDRAGAVEAFRRCLVLDAADRLGVGPRLARLGQGSPGQAMTDAYVASLFDDYAPRFERHLTRHLDYRGPSLIVDALDAVGAPGSGLRVLDLGCGTGLMGEAIRARASWLGGCDLSPVMVAAADRRGIYDRVEAASLFDVLGREPAASLDLVTAADVLVYVGDPDGLFAKVAAALKQGGHFAFTSQTFAPGEEPEDSIGVGADLRFRHGENRLRALGAAHGLPVIRCVRTWERRERGEPLPSLVVVCRRS